MGNANKFLKRAGVIVTDGDVEVAPPSSPSNVPVDWPVCKAILDEVVVRPMDSPLRSAGGIDYPTKTIQADRSLTCVGQIVDMGSLAYTAKTADGVDFNAEPHKPKIGDWVWYVRQGGQPMPVKDANAASSTLAPRLLWLKDNDIKGVFANEAEARKVWSWSISG